MGFLERFKTIDFFLLGSAIFAVVLLVVDVEQYGTLAVALLLILVVVAIMVIPERIRSSKPQEQPAPQPKLPKPPRVVEILARGGPQTLDECLLVFPGCCPKCGSRKWRRTNVSEDIPIGGAGYISNTTVYEECSRCDLLFQSYELLPSHGFLEWREFDIESPYLTTEEAAQIPELPYTDQPEPES